MQLFHVASVLYSTAALIPIAIYFYTRKHQDDTMVYLAAMVIVSFFVDSFGTINILWLHIGKPSNAIGTFYGYFEFVVVTCLYQTQLSPKK